MDLDNFLSRYKLQKNRAYSTSLMFGQHAWNQIGRLTNKTRLKGKYVLGGQ